MSINLIVIMQVANSDEESVWYQSSKTTALVTALNDDIGINDLLDLARARLDTVVSEVANDITEQLQSAKEN